MDGTADAVAGEIRCVAPASIVVAHPVPPRERNVQGVVIADFRAAQRAAGPACLVGFVPFADSFADPNPVPRAAGHTLPRRATPAKAKVRRPERSVLTGVQQTCKK